MYIVMELIYPDLKMHISKCKVSGMQMALQFIHIIITVSESFITV